MTTNQPILAIVTLLGLVSMVDIGPVFAADKSLRPANTIAIKAGKSIYANHCASCHGNNLEGQPNWRDNLPSGRMPAPPHDKTGHTWHHSDGLLFKITKLGTSKVVGGGYQSDMPGFEEILTDHQIIDVLSFIKSTWPEKFRRLHDGVNERAKLYGE
jgi:S-disulfanyl-L-cysteine oxidoreductase SoxD